MDPSLSLYACHRTLHVHFLSDKRTVFLCYPLLFFSSWDLYAMRQDRTEATRPILLRFPCFFFLLFLSDKTHRICSFEIVLLHEKNYCMRRTRRKKSAAETYYPCLLFFHRFMQTHVRRLAPKASLKSDKKISQIAVTGDSHWLKETRYSVFSAHFLHQKLRTVLFIGSNGRNSPGEGAKNKMCRQILYIAFTVRIYKPNRH